MLLVLGFQHISKTYTWNTNPEVLAEKTNSPHEAIQYLKSIDIADKANMFNGYNYGGYLIWNYPEEKTFIDGRMPHWRTEDRHLLKIHDEIQKVSKKGKEYFREYDIGYVLINRGAELAEWLKQHPQNETWEMTYQDFRYSVFIKKDLLNELDNADVD